jgi:anti-sigma factor RsiW
MNDLIMHDDELAELLGLYIDDALPEALRAAVERRAAADPAVAAELASLGKTRDSVRSDSGPRPADPWFVERTLGGLLRASSQASEPATPSYDRHDDASLLLEL